MKKKVIEKAIKRKIKERSEVIKEVAETEIKKKVKAKGRSVEKSTNQDTSIKRTPLLALGKLRRIAFLFIEKMEGAISNEIDFKAILSKSSPVIAFLKVAELICKITTIESQALLLDPKKKAGISLKSTDINVLEDFLSRHNQGKDQDDK